MSKIIKLTQEYIESLKHEFDEAITRARMSDGKFSFEKSFDKVERRATLQFTEAAWVKMETLIFSTNKEIAWHGVTERGEEDTYIVKDILVYPQKVASATVESDDDEYPLWYAKLTEKPEVFENLRMQGHSHVDMGVSPSATDLSFYQKILGLVGDEDYYIFVIFNKKGDKMVKIYDFQKNILFETADVEVTVIDTGFGFMDFVKDLKEMVKTVSSPTPAATQKSYGYGGSYSSYGGSYSSYGGYGYSGGGYYGSSYYGGNKSDAKEAKKADKKKSKYTASFKSYDDYEDWD